MRKVIVTTEWRGVFFGELAAEDGRVVDLKNVRNVIHWTGNRGFLGLCATGPDEESRLGDTAPSARLHGVTGVFDCSPEAAVALEGWE